VDACCLADAVAKDAGKKGCALRSGGVTVTAAAPLSASEGASRAWTIIPFLGVTQIIAWGSSYYLLAFLANPIAATTGWSLGWIVGGLSLGLLVAGIVSPRVGDTIQRVLVLATSAVFLALGLIGFPIVAAALVFYGCGIGIESIARHAAARRVRRTSLSVNYRPYRHALFMQAASPSLGSVLIERLGANEALGTLLAVALVNVLLVIVLFGFLSKHVRSTAAVASAER
jgi:hypothetical protein